MDDTTQPVLVGAGAWLADIAHLVTQALRDYDERSLDRTAFLLSTAREDIDGALAALRAERDARATATA